MCLRDTYKLSLQCGIEALNISSSSCFALEMYIHHRGSAKVMIYKYFKATLLCNAILLSELVICPNTMPFVVPFISDCRGTILAP